MMLRALINFGILFIFLIPLCHSVKAQYSIKNFDLEGDIYKWYDKALSQEKTGLVLGEYQEVRRYSRDTHQFFAHDLWEPSELRYRGQVYDSVFLMYDIHDDVLVIRHPTQLKYQSQPIRPIQNQVDSFTLAGHTFSYYDEEILNFSPGFFNQLYVGNEFDVIVKRIKDSRAEQTLIYVSTDVYIMRYKDKYHRLRGRGSVLRLFKEQKGEIRKYIRQNNLRIKPGNDQNLIKLARFCDELLKDQ